MGQGSKNGLKDKAYQGHVSIGGQMKRSIWHIRRIGQAIRTDKNAQYNRELEEERADQEMVRSGVSCVSPSDGFKFNWTTWRTSKGVATGDGKPAGSGAPSRENLRIFQKIK